MQQERIKVLAESCLKDKSHFVVDVILPAHKGTGKLLILVDGDEGFGIDDCAELSRALSAKLDEEAVIEGKYLLEVSSPGIDQPLKLLRQYRKNIGRGLKVHLIDGNKVEGKLVQVNADNILLEQESGNGKKKVINSISIPFGEINKTLVTISFK